GPISFQDQNRKAQTLISQLQNGTIKRIAEYSDEINMLNFHCRECSKLIWHDKMPIDQEIIKYRKQQLSSIQMIVIVSGSLGGIILSIFFVSFTLKYRHERYIKLSSPNLNNVLVIGCIHIYLAILLLGIEQWFIERKLLGYACMFQTFLFTSGFSLKFGSMFLKTLRVYRIFTSTDQPLLHSKGGMLDVDTIIVNEIQYCESNYRREIFTFIYIYKSIFLFFGGYLAFKTKHVHITALNDSRYIGWSIYIVLITSVFAVIMLEFTRSLNRQLVYVCISISLIIATTLILCIVFLPKIYKIKNKRNLQNEIVSNDLVMEARTRRFALGANYFEEYRYAQIQNRELKTELTQLDIQLHRLERRIEDITSIPKNTTLAFLPLAVQLASTFLYQRNDDSFHSPEAISNDIRPSTTCTRVKSKYDLMKYEEIEEESSSNETPSIQDSSELSLSVALQYSSSCDSSTSKTIQSSSSSSSSLIINDALDAVNSADENVEKEANNSTHYSLLSWNPYDHLRPLPFITSCSSDDESIIYSKLPRELEAHLAELDSDIEKFRTIN
ncbi:unnamed protein product, partial [Didymodactylos carnosus]